MVALQRGGVVLRLVAESRPEGVEPAALPDQHVPIVMADLVPEMPEHGPVGLVELGAAFFQLDRVCLGKRDRHHAFVVTGQHLRSGCLRRISQELEGEAMLGVFGAGWDLACAPDWDSSNFRQFIARNPNLDYLCSSEPKPETAAMSEAADAPAPPAERRDRSPAARQAARAKKAAREQRIVSLLNRGVSVAEIAEREGVSLIRMRQLVRTILAKRQPQAPAQFLALQVSRLNEALLVSYSAMYTSDSGANFNAIDRVVKIVRELDRYHGFSAAVTPRADPNPVPVPGPAENPLALPAPRGEAIGKGAATD